MSDRDAEFEALFETLKLESTTLILDGTLVGAEGGWRGTLDDLPLVRTRRDGSSAPDLDLRGTLGEGGMGIVHLARQHPLGREVAVKRPRNDQSIAAAERVLHEAFVTGLLEHPNVVPIHLLGRDENGAPLIVMKRIEGVCWGDVLRDPTTAPLGVTVDLAWHLGVLRHVCNAVRFAHDRGVIHRDIKPDNVMLGAFGEVYLVDWGIALSTTAAHDGRITHRDEARGVAGTPGYMAPEMTRDDAAEIDERTDVYLLGATLHELLTTNPPHGGSSLFEVMLSAYRSEPHVYEDNVPQELAAIARRAMHVDKKNRYQTVDELLAALGEYSEHRVAVALTGEAEERLAEAQGLLGLDDLGPHDDARLVTLFAEARFGFQQALEQWPTFGRAETGLQRVLELQFEHFVERRDVRGAAAVLTLLGNDGERQRALDTLRETLDAEQAGLARLEDLEKAQDPAVGWRRRMMLGFGIAGFWGGSAWYKAYLRWGEDPATLETDYLASAAVTVGIPLVMLVVFRRLVRASALNRRLVQLLVVTLIAIGMTRIVAHLIDAPLMVTTAFEFVLYGFAAAALGVMTEPVIALSALALFAAAILAAILPAYQMLFIAIAIGLFAAHQAWLWRPARLGPERD